MKNLHFYQPVSMWYDCSDKMFLERAKHELMQGVVAAYLDDIKEELHRNLRYNSATRRVETFLTFE